MGGPAARLPLSRRPRPSTQLQVYPQHATTGKGRSQGPARAPGDPVRGAAKGERPLCPSGQKGPKVSPLRLWPDRSAQRVPDQRGRSDSAPRTGWACGDWLRGPGLVSSPWNLPCAESQMLRFLPAHRALSAKRAISLLAAPVWAERPPGGRVPEPWGLPGMAAHQHRWHPRHEPRGRRDRGPRGSARPPQATPGAQRPQPSASCGPLEKAPASPVPWPEARQPTAVCAHPQLGPRPSGPSHA